MKLLDRLRRAGLKVVELDWKPKSYARDYQTHEDGHWDQFADLSVPGHAYWAEVGPDGAGGWSWEVRDTDEAGNQWTEVFGHTPDEASAKAAVLVWYAGERRRCS